MKTWEEIKEQYPDEHVAMINLQYPQATPGQLEGGEVIDHDSELDNLLARCDLRPYDEAAVLYTGDLGALIGERGMVRVIEE